MIYARCDHCGVRVYLKHDTEIGDDGAFVLPESWRKQPLEGCEAIVACSSEHLSAAINDMSPNAPTPLADGHGIPLEYDRPVR